MTFFRDLAALLQFSGFRRLFEVRLLSEGSNGIFQVALVSTVLLSPSEPPQRALSLWGLATRVQARVKGDAKLPAVSAF